MAAALREEFADDCDTMSNKQFKKEFKSRDAGIKVDAEALPEPRINVMKASLKKLVRGARYRSSKRERAANRAFEET
jgi:hypothetical protein